MQDIAVQTWYENFHNNSKVSWLSEIKKELKFEPYLGIILVKRYRVALCKFRCANHNLNVEVGRHNEIEKCNRFCKYCKDKGIYICEDEQHMLIECEQYAGLRIKYDIPLNGNVNTFRNLLLSTNEKELRNMAAFIYNAFKDILMIKVL